MNSDRRQQREYAYLNRSPRLCTQTAAMHVDAYQLPRTTMTCLHPREEVERSLLRLDAVHADVPSQFDGECELRFEDRDLVRKRYREWRELPPTVVHVGGVWRVRGRGVGNPADAVEPYFAEHRMWEGLERGSESGEDDGEGRRLGQGGK